MYSVPLALLTIFNGGKHFGYMMHLEWHFIAFQVKSLLYSTLKKLNYINKLDQQYRNNQSAIGIKAEDSQNSMKKCPVW